MVEKIHIPFADLREVIHALYLHRLGLYPVAVLPIAALRADLADVYLRIEVGRKRIAVVSGVAVEDIYIVYLVELMLQGIRREHARNARVKAAAQQCGESRLLKAVTVCPLPFILKLCRILRLIVCGVHIIRARGKARVHYREILIRKRKIQDNIRLELLYECR